MYVDRHSCGVTSYKIKSHLIIYRVSCNTEIHNEITNFGYFVCPFCDKKIADNNCVKIDESCCENKELISYPIFGLYI